MAITRRAATIGQLVGVICGCFLGMTNLFFMDLEATERLKRAQQLETIFEPVMAGLQDTIAAERVTLYLYDEASRELWTKVATTGGEVQGGAALTIIKLSIDAEALASHAARTRTMLNIADAHADPRHDGSWDRKSGFHTRAVLCYPIVDDAGKLYGCIQAVNKKRGNDAVFTSDDEKLMRMLSGHISIFVEAIGGS